MHAFDNSTTSKTTLVSGIFGVLATIVLFAYFVTDSETIGLAGDILFAISRILFIPLILAMAKISMDRNPTLARGILVAGVTGVFIMVISGMLLINKMMIYEQTVLGEALGAGLIGMTFFLFALSNVKNSNLNTIYKWFSIVIGFAVAANILNLVFPQAAQAMTDGTATFATVNPLLLIIMGIAGPLYLFGLPIWLILTGRAFSKEKLAIPAN